MDLKKSGRTWKGCCPFHGERTPSFHVYPEDKHFKCYGCGEHGDVFKFLQKLQGKEFPDVVRALAAEVGVSIPEQGEDRAEAQQKRRERNELLAACDAAARYWSARLASRYGEEGRRYLAERGVGEETIQQFRLGLASTAWSDLPARLIPKGVGEGALVRAGLIVARDNARDRKSSGHYDRFRGRLMFPICGADGAVIGFGGRVLGGGETAKYLNSPETPLYKKSKVLYALDLARESIRRTRSAVLVEGNFDAIGLHQVGVKNTVAVCGTALTPEHIELLKRFDCREITFFFDGDKAGAAAAEKAAAVLLPSGITGKVARLVGGDEGVKMDPDELARKEGKMGVEKVLSQAVPLTDFLIDRAVAQNFTGSGEVAQAPVEVKLAAVKQLKPHLLAAPEGLARSVFEDRIARRLGLDAGALRAELEGRRPAGEEPPRRRSGPAPTAPLRSGKTRVLLAGPAVDALGLLAGFPQLGALEEVQDLPSLLPVSQLGDLAKELAREGMPQDRVIARLEGCADTATVQRVRTLLCQGHTPQVAEREFKKALIRAKREATAREIERLSARMAESPTDDLLEAHRDLKTRRSDLEKRLRELERG
jgi:DNA primase